MGRVGSTIMANKEKAVFEYLRWENVTNLSCKIFQVTRREDRDPREWKEAI